MNFLGSGGSNGRKPVEEEEAGVINKKDDLFVSAGAVEAISFAYTYTKKGGEFSWYIFWGHPGKRIFFS